MKEVIGKSKLFNDDFPKKNLINQQEIFNQDEIAGCFNTFFTNVGSNLAAKIPHSEKTFSQAILKGSDSVIKLDELSIEEFQKAF